MEGIAVATRSTESALPKADLCLRTNENGLAELYVATEKGEFLVAGTIEVELGKLSHGQFLTAFIHARIAKLG